MSGPHPFRRELADLDTMLSAIGGAGWEGLEQKFAPAKVADTFEPEERIKRFLGAAYMTVEGREFIQWLADLTFRAPYPHVAGNFEAAALAAKAHEARAAVAESVLLALAQGYALITGQQESQT